MPDSSNIEDDIVQSPATKTPILLNPAQIRRNPKNPRQQFPQDSLERLAESIENKGVLVPITVYHDPTDDGTEYVLLDGERRWKAAKLINYPKIPAWVTEKPSGVDNALTMFHIHMLRDPWDEMSTAYALKEIMDDTGVSDDKDLSLMTGLSKDRVSNIKRVLSFPTTWHEKIISGDIPFNLPVELEKNILSKTKDAVSRKSIGLKSEDTNLRDLFLERYENGNFKDIVDLRKVGKLIDAAKSKNQLGERAKKALNELIASPEVSIDEAYEKGAAESIEVPRLLRDLESLPDRLSDVINITSDSELKNSILTSLRLLLRKIELLIKRVNP